MTLSVNYDIIHPFQDVLWLRHTLAVLCEGVLPSGVRKVAPSKE